MNAQSLSHVQLFATAWTIAPQTPLSMGFPRARILERVAPAVEFLLQRMIPIQGLNLHLLCLQTGSLPLEPMGTYLNLFGDNFSLTN